MAQKSDLKFIIFENKIEALEARVEELGKVVEQLLAVNKSNAKVIAKLEVRNQYLERKLYGRSSEKMPTPKQALRNQESKLSKEERDKLKRERRKKADEKRKTNREKNRDIEEVVVNIPVSDSNCTCPECGNSELDIVSEGRTSDILEVKLSKVYRKVFIRQIKSCRCGNYIVTAPSPEQVVDGGKYGPGIYADIIVGKCADSLPLNRQSKMFERGGCHIAPSVIGTMFNQGAEKLTIIWERLRELLVKREIILGDETTIKSQLDPKGQRKKKKLHTSYIWAFIANSLNTSEPTIIYYRYSTGRSEVPEKVLSGFKGKLMVDGYSGYNSITGLADIERAGCMSHMRRYFFESLASYPPVSEALLLVLELYKIEEKAKEEKIVGTSTHLLLREKESAPIMSEIKSWVEEHGKIVNPENPLMKAITYATNQWTNLQLFLKDARIPIDNNYSERTLRIIALGRKNYLFVGSHQAGKNLSINQTLTATCLENGVIPEEYFSDVLIRVNTHPRKEIDKLLPWNWKKYYGKDKNLIDP